MKPVQVSFDEELLEELDRSDEVKREGRSAVLRFIGTVGPAKMREVCRALAIATGCA